MTNIYPIYQHSNVHQSMNIPNQRSDFPPYPNNQFFVSPPKPQSSSILNKSQQPRTINPQPKTKINN